MLDFDLEGTQERGWPKKYFMKPVVFGHKLIGNGFYFVSVIKLFSLFYVFGGFLRYFFQSLYYDGIVYRDCTH